MKSTNLEDGAYHHSGGFFGVRFHVLNIQVMLHFSARCSIMLPGRGLY